MQRRKQLWVGLAIIMCVVAAGFAPAIVHRFQAGLDKVAYGDSYVTANPTESKAILVAALRRMDYPPPQRSAKGRALGEEAKAPLNIASHTLCMQPRAVTQPGSGCTFIATEDFDDSRLDDVAPLPMRRALIRRNAQRRVLDIDGLAGLRAVEMVEMARAKRVSEFGKDVDESLIWPGWIEASVPVLEVDRRHALIFLERYCNSLCGAGTLVYLELRPLGWQAVRHENVWVS